MIVRKRAGMRLLSILAAAAVVTAALPAQLFAAAEDIPTEPTEAVTDNVLSTYAEGENLLAGLEWTTDIPNEHFVYGQGPDSNPALKGWLTDGIYDEGDYVTDGAQVVGFNAAGYIEFDLGGNKTFRQVRINTAKKQSYQGIATIPLMRIEVYNNGTWNEVAKAESVPHQGLHAYVFSCSGDNTLTGSKIRFYFAPRGGGDGFDVLNELEVLEEAATSGDDVIGELTPPADPTEIVNLSLGKSYTIRRAETNDYPDTNGTELTDGVLGTTSYTDPAWSGCSYGGTTSGMVYDRWPLRSVIIDLGGTKSITQIQANFLTEASATIYQPQSVRTFASMDGINWMPLSRQNNINTYATGIHSYGWHVNGDNGVAVDLTGDENSIVLAQYVRFDIEKFSWNFMDEVTVMGYDGVHSEALPITNTTMLEDGEIQRADASTGNIHDMVLCYNGYGHTAWSVDRFKPYLTYVDQNGNSVDTMFDAAMFLGLDAPGTTGQAFATENSQITAEGWTWYLEKTFNGETSDIAYLNEAARLAAQDLEMPDYKIKLTVMIPYPPSQATNFGNLGGRDLDLSQEADWQYAIDWYIEQVVDYIQNGNYEYIDFLGFYWVNEYPSGIPRIQYTSERVHDIGYKFYWIPYFSSAGYFWNDDLGFDAITLQPNHFFSDPNENTFGAGGTTIIGTVAQIGAYAGLGVEMEFDGRLVGDVDKYNQGLDYLNAAVEYGFDGPEYYRNWYEGGGAIYDLAYSRYPLVREFYDNVYQVIQGTYEPREYIDSLFVSDPDNLLSGKTYTTSLVIGDPETGEGNYINDDEGDNLTDGLFVGQNYNIGPDQREVADFTFDLGSSKSFQQISIGTIAGHSGIFRPSRIQIQVSNDAEEGNWQTIYDSPLDNSEQTNKVFTFRTEDGKRIVARYLRFNVYFGSGTWISIDEIQVYDKDTGTTADGILNVPGEQPNPAEQPTITTDLPSSMNAVLGVPLTLSVEATVNDGGTLSYQWYKDNSPIGENSNTLTIDKVQKEDSGSYRVIVTNTVGGVSTSSSSTVCKVTVSDTNNIVKGLTYTTSLQDGDANLGEGDFQGEHPDVERSKLTDGLYGDSWDHSATVGYYARRPAQPVDITFHLGDTPKSFQQINIGAFALSDNGILLPSSISIEIKNGEDGEWRSVYNANVADTTQNKRFVFTTADGSSLEATDVRFMLDPASSWIFLDEIEILATADGSAADGTLEELTLPNIALNRPYIAEMDAAAGTYYPQNPDSGNELTDGVMGNATSYLDAPWTGFYNAEGVTISFDLGETATIYSVRTHAFTTVIDGITPPNTYTVQISNDGIRWETVYDDQSATGKDWLIYRSSDGVRARFVRIYLKTGLFLFLDEIEILGTGGKELEPEPDPDTLANQAKGKAYYLYASDPSDSTATFPDASEAAWPDANGSLLTDGVVDTSGDWEQNQAQWVSWQKDSDDMEITAILDLRAEKAIHEIITTFVQDIENGVGLPENMEVWVSNQIDGENINWLQMYNQAVPATSGTTAKITYTVPEIYRARYIKLVFKQTSDFMGLGEIEINGMGNTEGAADPIDLVSEGLSNLSQGKSYEVSASDSQYPDVNGQLTDGSYASTDSMDQGWTGFSFNPGGAQFVTIDLGDTYMVSKFAVNFLTQSGTTVLPNNLQFIVSQDGENWTTVYNSKGLASSGTTYKAQAFLGTPVKARYVMCYLYGASGISLVDEIEVFGDETPVDPDVTPPTPPSEVENYLIPGEATANISNLAILDTADSQIAGSVQEQGFDGAALVGDASRYSEMLSALNNSGSLKIVLGADNSSEIDSAISAFKAGSYGNLELVGILVDADMATAGSLASQIHQNGLKLFWIGEYDASGIETWEESGIDAAICRAGSASNLTAAAEAAKEYGMGMLIASTGDYDSYLDYLDAAVTSDFQGKYVFRAYNWETKSGTDEQISRMLESTEKLMKGTLKVSNRNTPAAPTADETYSTWVSLEAQNGYEYSLDGVNWTIDPVFTGLTPETSYTFYQRIKETHNAEASLMSEGLTVTTPEASEETGPAIPSFTTNLSSSEAVEEGDPLTLTVAASVSDGGTLSYQWYKDDQPISGETGTSFTIDSTEKSDEGSYKVIVTNTLNGETATAVSNICVITVETVAEPDAPSITEDLAGSRTVEVGDQVIFSVTAVSNNNGTLSYQWYKNGRAIDGATDASYVIRYASITDSGVYYVDVTDNSNNTHTTSNSCTLNVIEVNVPSGGGSSGNNWGTKPDIVAGAWEQLSDGSWQYVIGNEPVTGWKFIQSKYYYFNSNGIMVTGWFKDGAYWYYLSDSGAMQTGWLQLGNTWYYLREDGRMATGWLKLGNVWYYLKSSGAMQTGWLKDGNIWYYLYDWGGMANTSWVKVNNTWYYFRGNGAMMTGWLQQGNTWYYLKSSGAMATGWNWVGNKCYYFNESGKMAANTTVDGYRVDQSGAWVY